MLKKLIAFLLGLTLFISIAQAGDEVTINKLIQKNNVVKLEAKTYTIDNPIILKSGLTLRGVPGKTIILLRPGIRWLPWTAMMQGTLCKGVQISGMMLDGNSDKQNVPYGMGYHNQIFLAGCQNVKISNCIFRNSKGDGIRAKYGSNICASWNRVYRMGHDGIYFVDCKECKATDNIIETRTNSGIRLWNSINSKVSGNQITSQQDGKGGYAGIQIEYSKLFSNPSIEISGNTLYMTQGPGLQLIAYSQGVRINKGITVKNNRFIQAGVSTFIKDASGVAIKGLNGATITTNTFDTCYGSGILILGGGTGTEITKNTFRNTQRHVRDYRTAEWSGYAIANVIGAKIKIAKNAFSKNIGGNILN